MKNNLFIFFVLVILVFTGFVGQGAHVAGQPVAPRITIYVVPPITDEKILPTTAIPDNYISNEISIVASPGEYEPTSFVIHALDNIDALEVEATELRGESDSIPRSNIDIRVVKCWYQAGVQISDTDNKVLTSELLLKNDSLVKVEGGENYLKLATGEYILISSPDGVSGIPDIPTCDEFPVRDSSSLQTVDIPKDTNKQFWITAKVPGDSPPGSYAGKIQLRTAAGLIGELQLNLEVLPIELSKPYLTYSMYYRAVLAPDWPDGSISAFFKSEQQFRAELENLFNHGVTNPTVYQGFDEALLGEVLAIREAIGMGNQPVYYLGLEWGYPPIDEVREVSAFARNYNVPQIYFYGIDEPTEQELIDQREHWEAIHAVGGKVFFANYREPPFDFELAGDLLDLFIDAHEPSAEEAAKWHSIGHKIFSYANPHTGEEKPETYRRNSGLLLWQRDYDGEMNYAYQHHRGNIWNDFDYQSYRDHVFAYPTMDGVVDTIEWEGFREGVDDVRYLTTLLKTIEEVKGSRNTSSAEAWLADLKSSDLTTKDLDAVRSEIIDHLLYLLPPVLKPIGNKSVNEGELLTFTISAIDPDGDSLSYSGSNLPEGASFDPDTQTFSWTPDEAGVYPNVHFEVTDGELTDSEDITIAVDRPMTLIWATWGGTIGATLIVVILFVILLRRHRLARRSGQR
jgi:hypothetical protein